MYAIRSVRVRQLAKWKEYHSGLGVFGHRPQTTVDSGKAITMLVDQWTVLSLNESKVSIFGLYSPKMLTLQRVIGDFFSLTGRLVAPNE